MIFNLKSIYYLKTDRLHPIFVYAIIAYNVFEMVKSSFSDKNDYKQIITFKDISGLLKLGLRITEMLLVIKKKLNLFLKYYIT